MTKEKCCVAIDRVRSDKGKALYSKGQNERSDKRKVLCSNGQRVRSDKVTVMCSKKNSVALVRERTIPTERPPPVGEVSANFCG